jgi:hypothetical protein
VKVLLDEDFDHALRTLLGWHEVFTAAYMGWSGLSYGELLRAAENTGIEVLLTGDQTLCHEQNLVGRKLAVVALSAVELPITKKAIPAIIAAIDDAVPPLIPDRPLRRIQPEEATQRGMSKHSSRTNLREFY